MDVPSRAVLEAHGLFDSEFEPAIEDEYSAHHVKGHARFEPVEKFPLYPHAPDISASDRVCFCFCSEGNFSRSARFRRHAQLLSSYLVSSVAPAIELSNAPTARPDQSIIAWWEDEYGLWLVLTESKMDIVELLDAWSGMRGPEEAGHLVNGVNGGCSEWNDYALLSAIARCIHDLHQRRLTLQCCRPSAFSVVKGDVPSVVLSDFSTCTPIIDPQLSIDRPGSPAQGQIGSFTSATLFTDTFLQRNLRYLAPETAESRQCSPVADIYSFGVLMYELFTGERIDGRVEERDDSEIDLLVDIHRHLTTEITSPIDLLKRQGRSKPQVTEQLNGIVVKCLSKDTLRRYGSMPALIYDLHSVCRGYLEGKAYLSNFQVGEIDSLSRPRTLDHPVQREEHLHFLEKAFKAAFESPKSKHPSKLDSSQYPAVAVWGLSGSGKTRVVSYWAEKKAEESGAIVAYAKLDEHIRKPLSSFTQIFQSLFEYVLTDPKEDSKQWTEEIKRALGNQYGTFLCLLSNETRRLLKVDAEVEITNQTIDWDNVTLAFQQGAKKLLQLFARPTRRLILVLDDVQWMASEEIDLWKNYKQQGQPLADTFVISLHRTEIPDPPRPDTLISEQSPLLFVPRLDQQGVQAMLKVYFHDRIQESSALATLLFVETGGNPLYLRAMLTTLVNENVVTFDFDHLFWRFDLAKLQSHLSDAGVDAYLQRLLKSLAPGTVADLMLLSCLPSSGFDMTLLSQLLDRKDVEASFRLADSAGSLITIQGRTVRFAHDRVRMSAYRLIAPEDLGRFHKSVSDLLRRPLLNGDYVFDAANHALQAISLGEAVTDSNELIDVLLDASATSAISASFMASKGFLDTVDGIINQAEDFQSWLQDHRLMYMRFLGLYAEVCSALKLHTESSIKLDAYVPLCVTDSERVQLAILRVRQKIAASCHVEAIDLTWDTLCEQGYDPIQPTKLRLTPPSSVEQVQRDCANFGTTPADENDVRVLIINLLGHAGPTIFVGSPERRREIFALGYSLVIEVGTIHEGAAYTIAVAAITITDVPVKTALSIFSQRLCDLTPQSYLTSSTLVVLFAMDYMWRPLGDTTELSRPAFEASVARGNYELANYVMVCSLGSWVASSEVPDWKVIAERYGITKSRVSSASLIFVHACLQFYENIHHMGKKPVPWALEGPFISKADVAIVSSLPWHLSIIHTMALRGAILYDAPIADLLNIAEAGSPYAHASAGTIFGPEWAFLTAICEVYKGDYGAKYEQSCSTLRLLAGSADWQFRLDLVLALRGIMASGIEALAEAEAVILQAEDKKQDIWSGFLNAACGKMIMETLGNVKLAKGYIEASLKAYQTAGAYGLCEMLHARYSWLSAPAIKGDAPSVRLAIEQVKDTESLSAPKRPPLSENSSGLREDKSNTSGAETADSLDTLASALALASESDPSALLRTLLKILCQFARADYAAIAICEETDQTKVRLRAAGQYGKITSYDIPLSDDTTQSLCPAVYMTHVVRTGKAIHTPADTVRLRVDPFFKGRQPRSLLCLPIHRQGKEAGVIVLSSMLSETSQTQTPAAKEVISCLATFATIVTANYSFTRRLEAEVSQRTQELTNALAAKTQFLSHCSHELRSPLSAILGLTTVMQASAGLSPVQSEHLRTIQASGEDLLGLINNILDHSRLESHSVSLEKIEFSLRDVVENALGVLGPTAQQKDIELSLNNTFLTDPPGLLGDPFRIKQVLLNLLSNAVKFTPKGQVTVSWEYKTLADDRYHVTIRVQDTGIGIAPDKMDKLFRSFSQVDASITRSFGGSGLGLIISRDLARLLGGDCTATSQVGKGSTFTFDFVVEKGTVAPTEFHPSKQQRSCSLICRPGPWVTTLAETLSGLSCETQRYDSVEQYMRSLPVAQRDFAVFIDSQILTTDSLRRLQLADPDIRIFFLVPSLVLSQVIQNLEISHEAVISRPIKFQSLCRTVFPAAKNEEQVNGSSVVMAPKRKKTYNKDLAKTCPLRILFVDDNPVNVTVGLRLLGLFGYKVSETAANGQQAVDLAEGQPFDLIFLDLQMPIMDGYTAQERIRESKATGNPRVVALTANVDKIAQKRCLDAGFYDYLSKPVDVGRLESILRKVYESVRVEVSQESEGRVAADRWD